MLFENGFRLRAEQDLDAEIGQAFGQQALRGAHEEDRLFEPTVPPDQARFLTTVLGVVTGIGLVRHEMTERGAQDRKVRVDRDAAAQAAEVVVESRPRFAGLELPFDVLTFGKPEELLRSVTKVVGQRANRRIELVDRHRLGLAPRDVSLPERTHARHDLVQQAVCGFELVLGDEAGSYAVTPLDLVDIGDVDAIQLLGGGFEPDELCPQPSAPVRIQRGLTAAAVELGDERSCVRRAARQRARVGAAIDPTPEIFGSVIGVDDPVDMLAELESELEISIDQRRADHERSADVLAQERDGLIERAARGVGVVHLGPVIVEERVLDTRMDDQLDLFAVCP